MDNVFFLWGIIILLIVSLVAIILASNNAPIGREDAIKIIDKYKNSIEFQKEISELAEKKFQSFKDAFLKEQVYTPNITNDVKFESSDNISLVRESVEKPNFDYSDVRFLHEVEPTISQKDLLEIMDKRDIKKIDRKFLFPKKNVENTSSEFYQKKVVITGDFKYFKTRNELAEILYNLGADIDTSVTTKTNYLIKGENCGWSKEAKALDVGAIIYTEDDFLQKIKS